MNLQIFSIAVTNSSGLKIEVGMFFILILVLIFIIFLFIQKSSHKNTFFSAEVELSINLGGIGNVKLKRNADVAQIAHKAWTEFITRKAGLAFDPEHDVIIEVYNSWKELFERVRSLIKDIPASRVKNDSTQKLVSILVDSLNKGLRPHLTKWQAKFRRWYDAEIKKPENETKTPQEIQRMYPEYDALVQDLILINQQIISYTNELKRLSA